MYHKRTALIALVAKVTAFLFCIGFVYLLLWLIPLRSDLVYASVLDKHALLLRQPAPRVIFVGGSGIALGLDSTLIEERIGIPVVNMGVNAGFGLHYMLDEVRPSVQRGDSIVVVPEYEHFYGTLFEGDQNLLWALRLRPTALRQATWEQLRLHIADLPLFMQYRLREILHPAPDPIYNRRAFDDHGDFINHLALPSTPLAPYAIADGHPLNLQAVQAIVDFSGEMRQRGATVYLLYPTIAAQFWAYRDNQQAIAALQQELRNSATLVVLGIPQAYVLPDQYFFDTVYHLNRNGRKLRSEHIAAILQVAINANAPTLGG